MFTQVCAVGEHPEDFEGVHHGEAVRRISAGEKNRRRSLKKTGLEKIVVDAGTTTQQVPLSGLQPEDQHQQKQFTRHDTETGTLFSRDTDSGCTHTCSLTQVVGLHVTDWLERARVASCPCGCLPAWDLRAADSCAPPEKRLIKIHRPPNLECEFAAVFTSGPDRHRRRPWISIKNSMLVVPVVINGRGVGGVERVSLKRERGLF